MRSVFLSVLLAAVLAACGDEPTSNDGAPSETPPVANESTPPAKGLLSNEGLRSVAERMKKNMAKGNRMPGMPNDSLEGDPKSASEALRRMRNMQLGTFSEEQLEKFVEATKDLIEGDAPPRSSILQSHGMSEMQYRMIESLFKRAKGIGPALNDTQKKLVAPWLDAWTDASKK